VNLEWVEVVRDLQTAKVRIQELQAHSPGEYVVFSQGTQQIVARFNSLMAGARELKRFTSRYRKLTARKSPKGIWYSRTVDPISPKTYPERGRSPSDLTFDRRKFIEGTADGCVRLRLDIRVDPYRVQPGLLPTRRHSNVTQTHDPLLCHDCTGRGDGLESACRFARARNRFDCKRAGAGAETLEVGSTS
jgi:hypothetical protein